MRIERVALIYDDRPRPETTGFYCLRALQELVQVEHVLPDQLETVGPGDFDLYLSISFMSIALIALAIRMTRREERFISGSNHR